MSKLKNNGGPGIEVLIFGKRVNKYLIIDLLRFVCSAMIFT